MGEDKYEHSLGYTYTEKKDCSNFFPESNFEKYAAEHIKILHEKFDNLSKERNVAPRLDAESSSEEETIESY